MSNDTKDPHAMNRRLYAIDVALVGEDAAYKRWLHLYEDGWWACRERPLFNAKQEYRRDPEAPALPSWGWQAAHRGAAYRLTNQSDQATFYASLPPTRDDWPKTTERRPPPEWFEATCHMTHAEYEALRHLARGGAVEPASDDPADDGVLSGAAKHRAFADAMDSGGGPRDFEIQRGTQGWKTVSGWPAIYLAMSHGDQVRRKPKTCFLVDANGAVYEIPMDVAENYRVEK